MKKCNESGYGTDPRCQEIQNIFRIRKERNFLLNILPVGAGRFKVRTVTSVWLNWPPVTRRRRSRPALMISTRLCATPRRFSSGKLNFFPMSRNFVRTYRYLCQDYFYFPGTGTPQRFLRENMGKFDFPFQLLFFKFG
jgi:hypothetical protein